MSSLEENPNYPESEGWTRATLKIKQKKGPMTEDKAKNFISGYNPEAYEFGGYTATKTTCTIYYRAKP